MNYRPVLLAIEQRLGDGYLGLESTPFGQRLEIFQTQLSLIEDCHRQDDKRLGLDRLLTLAAMVVATMKQYGEWKEFDEPNWAKAPSWAQWWAVDENGKAHWYEEEPFTSSEQWLVTRNNWEFDKMVDLSAIDWKDTLRGRST